MGAGRGPAVQPAHARLHPARRPVDGAHDRPHPPRRVAVNTERSTYGSDLGPRCPCVVVEYNAGVELEEEGVLRLVVDVLADGARAHPPPKWSLTSSKGLIQLLFDDLILMDPHVQDVEGFDEPPPLRQGPRPGRGAVPEHAHSLKFGCRASGTNALVMTEPAQPALGQRARDLRGLHQRRDVALRVDVAPRCAFCQCRRHDGASRCRRSLEEFRALLIQLVCTSRNILGTRAPRRARLERLVRQTTPACLAFFQFSQQPCTAQRYSSSARPRRRPSSHRRQRADHRRARQRCARRSTTTR